MKRSKSRERWSLKLPKTAPDSRTQKLVSQIILTVVSLAISAPLLIMIYRYVPDIIIHIAGNAIRLDHILTAILIFALVRYLLGHIYHLVLYVVIAAAIFFSVSHFTGWYTYAEIRHRYYDLIAYVESNPVKIPFLKDEKMTIRNSRQIREAIDYKNPDVRNYAINISQANFNDPLLYREYGHVIRYFSIFSEVVKWNYVPDPIGEEYYARASESMHHLSGDCDDYSILMAACIRAVGGEVRLVHTKSHLYPEVKVCHQRDFDKIINLIKRNLYFKESLGGSIYYHIDRDDYIWLNFDYTTRYPGGPFMNEAIIGILVI
ncbi:MAG: hypothetical protein R6V49_05385 [Bacteroidales bacterium]